MNKPNKIMWSVISALVCLVYRNNAVAADCPSISVPANASASLAYRVSNCKTKETKCWRPSGVAAYCFESCVTCNGTLPRKSFNPFLDGAAGLHIPQCSGAALIYDCECKCSNCTETGNWVAKGTGYEQKTGKSCSCSTGSAVCTTSTYYRCAAGYYGSPTNGTFGCTPCPTPGTSVAGTVQLAQCYIPKGTYSDSTGKYVFNCDCPYNGKDSCGSSSSSAA